MMRPDPVFLLVLFAAQNQGGEATQSTRDGVYTDVQARRGEAVFADACAACHLPEYFTVSVMPSWSGAPLAMLFDVVSTTMPQDRPGRLTPQEYADVLAYVLALNGLPTGAEELPATRERLARILLERSEP